MILDYQHAARLEACHRGERFNGNSATHYEELPLWNGRNDCDLDTPLGCVTAFIASLPLLVAERAAAGEAAYFSKSPEPHDHIARSAYWAAEREAWREQREMCRLDAWADAA